MISLLVINYRSVALAARAIQSARESSDEELQVVVVDNSMDAEEAERLRPLADDLFAADKNLGYAGGINAGRPLCRGDILIVSNPDVVYGPRAIDELVRALREREAAVAGPALYWDDSFEWILPPSELHTAAEKMSEVFASRSAPLARRRDRRRIAERVRFWSLHSTTEMRAISGAVMAIRAADFDSAGGFDERFPLYFEETDFLRRTGARGRPIVYVPSAKVRHLFNQSAGDVGDRAAAAYAQSEMLYLKKWNGDLAARAFKSLERSKPHGEEPKSIEGPIELPPEDVVVEASPLQSFDTAAGHIPRTEDRGPRTGSSVNVPEEVWQTYRSAALYLRVIDRATMRVLASYARYRS